VAWQARLFVYTYYSDPKLSRVSRQMMGRRV
jgi:hypothetical protein